MLKAPLVRLKPEDHNLLSTVAFEFDERPYYPASSDRSCIHVEFDIAGTGITYQHGRAVQVDPIKPMLKAPGTKGLILTCDDLLSNFAFHFNLRRYSAAITSGCSLKTPGPWYGGAG